MRRKSLIFSTAFVVMITLLASCSKSSGSIEEPKTDPKPSTETPSPEFNKSKDKLQIYHEFRAVWLTTVSGLDWPNKTQSASYQIAALKEYIQNIKKLNCNAVIMQVCCNMEAYWTSSILPWAAQLTGTQGKDPGYDPLAVAVKECHDLGLEIHAWINPLRCSSVSTVRAANHPYNIHPEWAQVYGSTYYWDAGNPEVADFLASIATELMTNYDLDGLHIDDFFYPDGLKNDAKTWDDAALFALYGGGKTLTQWRESNINRVVKSLHTAVHNAKPSAIFGVSPAGRMELTTYLYADPRQWIAEGSIDYLAPQIYWPHSHSFAAFNKVLYDWRDVALCEGDLKSVPMIPGLAPYRYGESGFEKISEFLDQVEDCRKANAFARGNIWFRAQHVSASTMFNYIKNTIYPYPSLMPKLEAGVLYKKSPLNAPTLSVENKTLKWNSVDGANQYALYELERVKSYTSGASDWRANLISVANINSYKAKSGKNYTVVASNSSTKDISNTSNVIYVE